MSLETHFVHRYIMHTQSGDERPGQEWGYGCDECVRVHRYTMSKQSGEEDAASVCGYTGTL